MARINLDDVKIVGGRHGAGKTFESMTFVNADNAVLSANAPPLVFLNPAGAVDLLMPTSNAARQGLMFIIVNLSANTVTLKTDGDAAFTAAIAIAATQMAIVVCTGSSTQVVGWRAMVAAGTQTSP